MQECQPSLRDYGTHGWITRDFILGSFRPSLGDLPFAAKLKGKSGAAEGAVNGYVPWNDRLFEFAVYRNYPLLICHGCVFISALGVNHCAFSLVCLPWFASMCLRSLPRSPGHSLPPLWRILSQCQ